MVSWILATRSHDPLDFLEVKRASCHIRRFILKVIFEWEIDLTGTQVIAQ